MRATIVEQDASVDPGHYSGAGHVMGGCRMAASAADGVTNADARALIIRICTLWARPCGPRAALPIQL